MANTFDPKLSNFQSALMQAQELQNGVPEVGDIPTFNSSGSVNPQGLNGIVSHVQDALSNFNDSQSQLREIANEQAGYLENLQGTPYDILGRIPQENLGWFEEKTGIPYWQAIKNISNYIQSGDFKGLQGYISNLGDYSFPSSAEKWLDNKVSEQNTAEAQKFEEHMRDTDITSSGAQLESLGLSSSGVLQATAGHSGLAAASNSHSNLSQPMALAKFNMRMMMGKALLSLASSMGSAGVYGKALGAAKSAAGKVAAGAAHSALQVMTNKTNIANKYVKVDPETYRIAKTPWLDD